MPSKKTTDWGFIYIITNIINGDFYIGQTRFENPKVRLTAHISNALRRNIHNNRFYNAIEKYGQESFIFSVIYECPKELLDFVEIYFISKYSPVYNTSQGGKSTKGFLGKSLSKAHKDALTNSNKKVVYQYTLDGQYVGKYSSISDYGNLNKCNSKTISHCLRGIQKTALGYRWFREYLGNKIEPLAPFKSVKARAIQLIDNEGNKIRRWDCMSDACKELNLDTGKVTLVCQGKRKTTKGFKFRYE